MSEWQPIETAPKDGSRILAYGVLGLESEPSIGTVQFNNFRHEWYCDPCEASEYEPEACKVTHWMPLPAAPNK